MKNTLIYYAKQTIKQPLLYTTAILTAIFGYTHIGLHLVYERIRDWHIPDPTYTIPRVFGSSLDPDPYITGITQNFKHKK